MAKTPSDIDLRQHARSYQYYDGKRYADDAAVDAALGRGRGWWWICYFGPADDPYSAEEDVVAPSKSEASAVMRCALARDFDPVCKLTEVKLA